MLRPFRSIVPAVDPSAFVDASAQVVGDVQIGPESSIWMNVVVRGDVNYIRIGARTNIQDLTLVHVMRNTHPTLIGYADTYVRYRLDFQAGAPIARTGRDGVETEHTPA
jgi:carbonic anhydrase/acetyltransferase-like protein (isoleucine patch superfamily)